MKKTILTALLLLMLTACSQNTETQLQRNNPYNTSQFHSVESDDLITINGERVWFMLANNTSSEECWSIVTNGKLDAITKNKTLQYLYLSNPYNATCFRWKE